MDKSEKSDLLRRMYQAGIKSLRRFPVQRVKDFEKALGRKFKKECDDLARKLKSGRIEWLNLVDWVKAHLTRQGLIRYFQTGEGERFIVFLEPCGRVNGEVLVACKHALAVIASLGRLLRQLPRSRVTRRNDTEKKDASRCRPG